MKKINCSICNMEIKVRNEFIDGKPHACSKKCKTNQFNNLLNEWYCTIRGYPRGHLSIESYQLFLYKEKNDHNKNCIVCNEEFQGKYNKQFCSYKCSEKHRIKQIAITKLERYGDANYRNSEKAKQTCIIKYGVENPLKSTKIRNKIKNTCIEKYGVENPFAAKEIIEKIENTNLERYGVKNIFELGSRMADSYEAKFGNGIRNPQQVKEISERTFATRKSRYVLQGAVPKESYEKTCLEKYGTTQFFASSRGKMSNINLKDLYGYTVEDIDQLNKSRANCTFQFYLNKFIDVDIAKEEFLKRLEKCDSNSYDWALQKANFDVNLADKIFSERQQAKKISFGMGSKLSLKTFEPVEQHIIEKHNIDSSDIYIGDGTRKEFFLYDSEHKRVYFYDFTIRSKNLIIEFNGCFYHQKTREENPIKYDQYARKIEWAKQNGFKVIVIWDDNTIKNNQQILKEWVDKCLIMQK